MKKSTKKQSKFKQQYTGNRSVKIWETLNSLPEEVQQELFSCFVLLQNMEGSCLTWLNNAIEERDTYK